MEIGERFDPLAGVTAQDAEDGEITLTEENIIDNDVDTSKAGTYPCDISSYRPKWSLYRKDNYSYDQRKDCGSTRITTNTGKAAHTRSTTETGRTTDAEPTCSYCGNS